MPRFSIVITTVDRPALLGAAIRSVLASRFDDYELIVSDNFSEPSAAAVVSQFSDPRLRSLRTDRRLAMTDHWEFAWEHVRGDFVLYLGDDNALHPDILAYSDRAIAEHDLDLMSWRCSSYFHPDWRISYGNLPDRGNIMTFEPGTTGGLYQAVPAAILRSYCEELRLPGCFPGMINCLFSRVRADEVRRATGKLFWPLAPDVCVAYFMLGMARPGKVALLDGYAAIGGRSQDSNVAAFLTEGRSSKRADDLFSEYGGADYFPHHPVKFRSMSNIFAVTATQAYTLMPERFASWRYSLKTLALRTIDDIHVLRITPWASDPTFVAQFEAFIESLPPPERNEVLAYREQCMARQAPVGAPQPRTEANERHSLWRVDASYYLDMAAFGAHDIGDAAAQLPRVMGVLDHASDRFVRHNRALGHVGEALASSMGWPLSQASAAAA